MQFIAHTWNTRVAQYKKGLWDQALHLILLSSHITRYFEIKELILEALSVKRQGGSGVQGEIQGKISKFCKTLL